MHKIYAMLTDILLTCILKIFKDIFSLKTPKTKNIEPESEQQYSSKRKECSCFAN